jgi:hypothetical protein
VAERLARDLGEFIYPDARNRGFPCNSASGQTFIAEKLLNTVHAAAEIILSPILCGPENYLL